MCASYLPFFVFAKLPTSDADSIIAYLASQTGYLAAVLLLWQFVLGTRSVSALVHKDQAWALGIHKKIGIYGIALVLTHPLLIAYSYSENLLYLFWGGLENEFAQHVAFGRIAFLIFLMIWFTSAILRAKIGYRPWKYIHYSTYLIMPLIFLHTPGVGSFYAADSALRVAWQMMIALFTLMLALRARQLFTYGQYPYQLVEKKSVAEGVYLYRFSPIAKHVVSNSGQYIYLRRGFWSEEHPFSVVASDQLTGDISITSKIFGKYTTKLSQTDVGSIFYLDGPYGVFTQQLSIDKSERVVFIAGGIGITPFIEHILRDDGNNITLFNANRKRRNVVLGDILPQIMSQRYIEVFSDDPAADNCEHGYVTAELVQAKLGQAFAKCQFYICGPPIMMQKVRDSLLNAGIPKTNIRTEEFGF
jgi:predicted ferric reductase